MQTPTTKSLPSQTLNHFGLGMAGLEGVEVLEGLGLSGRQARVYLALLRVGDAKARSIAGLAGVPRQEVYGLLVELAHLGLVNQKLTVPISYSAKPLSEVIKMLFDQKECELALIARKAKKLTKKLNQTQPIAANNALPKPCFGIVSEGERGKKYQTAIQQTQHTIQATTSWTRFKQLCFHFETQLTDALKRGVKVSIVTEKPANHQLPKWVNPARQKYLHFKLKTITVLPEAAVTIFDCADVAVAFSPSIKLTKGPDLWTSHPALIAPYQTYFYSVWVEAKKCPTPIAK